MADLIGRLPSAGTYPRRSLDGVRYIVIHHSGVDVDSTAVSIAQYHRSLGWPGGIGYHAVIHWDGRAEWTQPLDVASYHVAGRNGECIGVCLPGDWSLRQPPEAQLRATRYLVASLKRQLRRDVPVVGHREIALSGHATTCPGSTWEQWRHLII